MTAADTAPCTAVTRRNGWLTTSRTPSAISPRRFRRPPAGGAGAGSRVPISSTVLFEVSWLSYVPGLVPKEQLIEANGKVAASSASAEVAGPGLGGLLVQLLTAPTALLVDAVSYAVSLASLLLIGTREPAPAPPAGGRRNLRGEIADGVRLVVNQPFLRVTAVQGAV